MAKHLSYEERNAIEIALNQGVRIQTIATILQCDRRRSREDLKCFLARSWLHLLRSIL